MSRNEEDLEAQIAGLKTANSDDLHRMWRRLFAKTWPSHLPRHLVVAMLAYRLQVNAHGDMSQEHKKYLDAVGRSASRETQAAVPKFSPERKRYKPGTVFVREHEGVQHLVLATSDGLQWGNQTYSSLSAVARAITGTNWNGPRFFGLLRSGE